MQWALEFTVLLSCLSSFFRRNQVQSLTSVSGNKHPFVKPRDFGYMTSVAVAVRNVNYAYILFPRQLTPLVCHLPHLGCLELDQSFIAFGLHGCPLLGRGSSCSLSLPGCGVAKKTNHPTFWQLSITHSVLFHVVRIAKVLVKSLTTLRLRGPSGWVHPWSLTTPSDFLSVRIIQVV